MCIRDRTVTVTPPAAGETEMTEDVPLVLPIGAVCTVTETDDGGAAISPPPVTVTIVENAEDNTVQATFTNEFSAGTVAVSKELAGAGARTTGRSRATVRLPVRGTASCRTPVARWCGCCRWVCSSCSPGRSSSPWTGGGAAEPAGRDGACY